MSTRRHCNEQGIQREKNLNRTFDNLTDPRKPDDILHKLIDIVAITILAVMCGANGWNDIELLYLGKVKKAGSKHF